MNDAAILPIVFDKTTTVRSYLEQSGILRFMETEGVTEIAINRPGEIATEGSSGWTRHLVPECTLPMLEKLGNALCVLNGKHITRDDPIQNIVLPDGERGQVLFYPACEENTVSITIRIPSKMRLTMDDYEDFGAFDAFVDESYRADGMSSGRMTSEDARLLDPQFEDASFHTHVPRNVHLLPYEHDLLAALKARKVRELLEGAIKHKLNIVFVGGTGSGKTTLMKAMADLVDPNARIGTIEDTHELPLPNQWNKVHMFYSAKLPAQEIVKSTLRMKFDRVYLAELRGAEAWDYMGLLNTGHEGGMTSIHANGPREVFPRIATLVKQSEAGRGLDYDFILREAKTTIDLVLFMHRKKLTRIFYDPVEKFLLQNGMK
ncbi:ATPase, T2SS/T4P/T4SS family [Paraburkholderia tropica]|uniref:ATPase, T2SS/T4P/T4SS family n=1 Tax=Paraburkholderia tropica TaxID=92647 RepID=UPI002AB62831|nr:ATPase, T2SS/T4P/T4SS family [Paraburkholderia tropica]